MIKERERLIKTSGPSHPVLSDCPPARAAKDVRTQPETSLAEILYEQLGHLIQYADQEPDRFQRVKSILMETFN